MFLKHRSRTKRLPSGKTGERAYVVGDVHGCFELLIEILKRIDDHENALPRKTSHLIFLGDLIDRGPASREVIETLIDTSYLDMNYHFIMGNHEEALVRGLSGELHLLEPWLKHGGYETAESYGIERSFLLNQPQHVLEHTLLSAIPDDHLKFMAGFSDSIRFGDYLFVHAGIRPGVKFEKQTGQDMKWIRQEFLQSTESFEYMVVHGHTVSEAVDVNPNRIGLDTGAYKSGILSAMWIEDEKFGFLDTNIEQVS